MFPQSIANQAKSIRLIAFDVDGIMTDGGLYLSDSGEEFKRFNSLDGHGLNAVSLSILVHGTSVKPLMSRFLRYRRHLPPA